MFSLYSLWGLVLLHVVLYTVLHSVEWRCSAAQRSAGTRVLSLQILLQPHCHLEGRVRNQFTHLLSPSTSLPNLACSFSWMEEMSLQKRLTLPLLIYPSLLWHLSILLCGFEFDFSHCHACNCFVSHWQGWEWLQTCWSRKVPSKAATLQGKEGQYTCMRRGCIDIHFC